MADDNDKKSPEQTGTPGSPSSDRNEQPATDSDMAQKQQDAASAPDTTTGPSAESAGEAALGTESAETVPGEKADSDATQPDSAQTESHAPRKGPVRLPHRTTPSDEAGSQEDSPQKETASPAGSSTEQTSPATVEGSVPEQADMPHIPQELPIVPVRDVVLFNFMILPLFISRGKSVKAIEDAAEKSHFVLVLTQKSEKTDDPEPGDLYQVGTVVHILRMLKMPDGRAKVLVQGVARAKVDTFLQTEPFPSARVNLLEEPEVPVDAKVEALLRLARELSEKVLSLRGLSSPELVNVIQGVDEPGRLADLIASNLRMKTTDAQHILEETNPVDRLQLVAAQLQREMEVAAMQMRIQSSAKEGMDKAQKDYFLREQIKAIRHELGDAEEDAAEELDGLKKALKKAGLPADVKKEADKELRRLSLMHSDSSEASVSRSYLELISELPWKKASKDNLDIANAKKTLDEDHYGLDKIKDRILEFLSVHKLNPQTKGSILCFVGPPGVGKTSLGKSIARALGRRFERLSLGGMHDEAEIRGHRRTYIGAMPGRILQVLRHAGTRNPVIVLDEIDKIGTDFRGDPQSALLEVLDPEQNNTFSDHYLNLPFDLSKVMFLCTANQLDTIPQALRDRMEIITLSGYTSQEKLQIAKRYLLAKRISDNGLKPTDIKVTDAAIEAVISDYTREAGVRELERKLGTICRKMARRKAEGEKPPFTVDAGDLHTSLGPAIFLEEEKNEKLLPGMALGLAWTQAGGEVLTIEASVMKGKGSVQLTGSLGDVMKESAQAAVSYIRSLAGTFHVDPDFTSKHDIHIHVPDGATPKDGPSAGVTLTTALLSALKNAPVRSDLCMTGEIDIKGRVLPVGGIKEKLLGAVARGITNGIIPWQNQKDLEDIPQDLLKKISIHPVRYYTQVYELAFSEADRKKQAPRKASASSAKDKGTSSRSKRASSASPKAAK